MSRTDKELLNGMSNASMDAVTQAIANTIDKHIINTILAMGDMSSLTDKGVQRMIKICRKSFEENVNFNTPAAAKALQNLITLMGRQIKMDHCE